MRLVRFTTGEALSRIGLLVEGEVLEISGIDGAPLEMVLEAGPDAMKRLGAATNGPRHDLAEVTLLAPLVHPSKVICVGQNFAAHASETNSEIPSEPLILSKFPSSIIGPQDAIVLPAAAARRVDYEAELAVVIGRAGRDIGEAQAMEFVAGYMVANDVSARDWQVKKPGGQWLLGKSFDTFLPIGPALVTSDEIDDLQSLRITCRIGEDILQEDTVDHLIFGIPQLIAYVSQVATLIPGDLILTGTPAGVGSSRVPPRWLKDGDVVESAVTDIGTLRNPVRPAVTAAV